MQPLLRTRPRECLYAAILSFIHFSTTTVLVHFMPFPTILSFPMPILHDGFRFHYCPCSFFHTPHDRPFHSSAIAPLRSVPWFRRLQFSTLNQLRHPTPSARRPLPRSSNVLHTQKRIVIIARIIIRFNIYISWMYFVFGIWKYLFQVFCLLITHSQHKIHILCFLISVTVPANFIQS